MRTPPIPIPRAVLPLSLFLLGAAPLIAQTPTKPPLLRTQGGQQAPQAPQAPAQPRPAAMPDADQPYQPPALRFDPQGMTLLDAIKLTLQHDPNIKLADTAISRDSGNGRLNQWAARPSPSGSSLNCHRPFRLFRSRVLVS